MHYNILTVTGKLWKTCIHRHTYYAFSWSGLLLMERANTDLLCLQTFFFSSVEMEVVDVVYIILFMPKVWDSTSSLIQRLHFTQTRRHTLARSVILQLLGGNGMASVCSELCGEIIFRFFLLFFLLSRIPSGKRSRICFMYHSPFCIRVGG